MVRGWRFEAQVMRVVSHGCYRVSVADIGKITTTVLVHKNQGIKKPPDGGLMKAESKVFRLFSSVQWPDPGCWAAWQSKNAANDG